MFSEFLNSRRSAMKALCGQLLNHYEYVSVLGVDIRAKSIRADRNSSAINAGRDTECGFVLKLSDGKVFYEYSLDDISGCTDELCEKIRSAFNVHASLMENAVGEIKLTDEPLVQSFDRETDLHAFSDQDVLDAAKDLCRELMDSDSHLLNCVVSVGSVEVNKLFISRNRELDQHYAWINGAMVAVYKDNDKVVQAHEGAYDHTMQKVLRDLPALKEKLLDKARHLTLAKPVTPGVYDVITDSSITGLIAHEAFGHGVEMDMFVKDRALAKEYVGKYVASPICSMRDGAAGVLSAASYFFDDDGVLSHDTQIIKDGVLVTGISDLASAVQLGLPPTGNGRRESSRRKAYARMTNTYFEPGKDKLEDMIASIDHGYMLFETSNGMEDPKNWAIQCVAQYGIEIVDGKLTDNYVSPVVLSGYVPDLLKSISMVSDDFKVIGSGSCGKGHKEWVRVSDGGPALKVKVKLG